MAHTYHQHLYHLIWSTKERLPMISPIIKERLFDYIGGAFRKIDCHSYKIGGMQDHIHVLVGIPPKYSVSEIVKILKFVRVNGLIQIFLVQ